MGKCFSAKAFTLGFKLFTSRLFGPEMICGSTKFPTVWQRRIYFPQTSLSGPVEWLTNRSNNNTNATLTLQTFHFDGNDRSVDSFIPFATATIVTAGHYSWVRGSPGLRLRTRVRVKWVRKCKLCLAQRKTLVLSIHSFIHAVVCSSARPFSAVA